MVAHHDMVAVAVLVVSQRRTTIPSLRDTCSQSSLVRAEQEVRQLSTQETLAAMGPNRVSSAVVLAFEQAEVKVVSEAVQLPLLLEVEAAASMAPRISTQAERESSMRAQVGTQHGVAVAVLVQAQTVAMQYQPDQEVVALAAQA